MASKMASDDRQPTCPICLEAPPAVMVSPSCRHVFCRSCLSTHLKKSTPTVKHFPCPTCRVECPLPSSGIDDLPDYNGVNKGETVTWKADPVGEETSTDIEQVEEEAVPCHICRYTKSNVDACVADHICSDCGNLYFCKECILVHGKNEATKNHTPIPFKAKKVRKEGKCETHMQWITSYCSTCSLPVCQICIHIDHGDHSLQRFGEVFVAKVELVRQEQAQQVTRSRYLRNCENELKGLKSMADDKHDELVRAVEDQAEKYIQQIIQQKEAMKKQIKTSFGAIFEVTKCVDKIPELTARLDDSVAMSKKILSAAEQCPSDVARLSALGDEIEETGRLTETIDREAYWKSYKKIWESLPVFSPGTSNCNLGSLNVTTKENWDIKTAKLIFEKELQVDDKAKFIPSLTALGRELFAVAHPTTEGEPFNAVDIYKYPGDFQRSLRQEINPAYDMASTAHGNLALLSDGAAKDSCSVRIFDPVTGNLAFTKELDVRGQLISFDINLFHRYVVLSNDGGRKVTIFNDDGSVALDHVLDVSQYGIKDSAHKIACSGRFVYIAGLHGFAIYEGEGMNLILTDQGRMGGDQLVKDICTTPVDDVLFSYLYSKDKEYLVTYEFNEKALVNRKINTRYSSYQGKADRETRVSTRNNYVVSSHGQKLRVFVI